jgi:ribosome-binding protein aMBF1 (putative translation factor)
MTKEQLTEQEREELAKVKRQVADKIKKRLEELGMNKKQFAAAMKVSPSVVTKWLKGECNFEIFTIFKIEALLDFTIIKLVTK